MQSKWFESAPRVIAHRGASHRAPENTLRAFTTAVALGADAVELDARLARDGAVVIHHDWTLDRTTDGAGRLDRHTLAELERLDAGKRFGPEFAGERIPTLERVFETLGETVLYDIELSNYRRPFNRLPDAVIRLVRRHKLEDHVLMSSFNPISLRRVEALAPQLPRGLLLMRREPWWMRGPLGPGPVDVLQLEDTLASPESIDGFHREDHKVHVWVVNDRNRMRDLLAWGVDGLITDLPDVACEVLGDVLATD